MAGKVLTGGEDGDAFARRGKGGAGFDSYGVGGEPDGTGGGFAGAAGVSAALWVRVLQAGRSAMWRSFAGSWIARSEACVCAHGDAGAGEAFF